MNNTIENRKIVAIDKGSAFSCASYVEVEGTARTIPLGDGGGKIPSDIYLPSDGSDPLFGESARNMIPLEPSQVFSCYKRKLGSEDALGEWCGRKITADYLVGLEARKLLESVSEYLGVPIDQLQLVLTVPAQCDERQRQLIRHAFEKHGCAILRVVNEPTAAALAFDLPGKKGDCVAIVIDLGAGTSDVTVVTVEGGKIAVLASEGDNCLGGFDVDNIVRDEILAEFKKKHGMEVTMKSYPGDYCEIGDKARNAKELLSTRREATINARIDGKSVKIRLTRETLGKLITDVIGKIDGLISEVVKRAELQISDIDHVLLVGGTSRLHAVKELVGERFGKSKILKGSVSPDFAVVEGGAQLAARIVEESGNKVVDADGCQVKLPLLKHQEIATHSIGLVVQESVDSDTKICSVLLPKNTPLPATVTEVFTSVTDDQRVFDIKILQGEEGQLMEECLVVGNRDVEFEPRDHTIKSIEATIHYDLSGQCRVVIRDILSGREEDITADFVNDGGGAC